MNYYSTAPNISEFTSEQLESRDRLKIIREIMNHYRNRIGEYDVECIAVGAAELAWIKKHMQAENPQAVGPWGYAGIPIVHSPHVVGFNPIPKQPASPFGLTRNGWPDLAERILPLKQGA